MSETNLNPKISQMINDLCYECFNEHVPITILALLKSGDSEQVVKKVISPAAVGYEGNTDCFYDIQNVMSGNFTTVPTQSKEAEVDPFEEL